MDLTPIRAANDTFAALGHEAQRRAVLIEQAITVLWRQREAVIAAFDERLTALRQKVVDERDFSLRMALAAEEPAEPTPPPQQQQQEAEPPKALQPVTEPEATAVVRPPAFIVKDPAYEPQAA